MKLFLFIIMSFSVANAGMPAFQSPFPREEVHKRKHDQKLIDMYHQVIDEVLELHEEELEIAGVKLLLERHWGSGAYMGVAQKSKKLWTLRIDGGFIFRGGLGKDAFSLVVCHEFGHFFGGFPGYTGKEHWNTISAEGQADYYSTLKCARKLWAKDNNRALIAEMKRQRKIHPEPEKACQSHHDLEKRAICIRSATASLEVATLYANSQGERLPRYEAPYHLKVQKTMQTHPHTQCRLDTMVAGSVCRADLWTPLSFSNHHQGVCSRQYGATKGIRPLCWFSPEKPNPF